ncbi:hypothetical protein QL093DRAFT_2473392 [Fusarium oxysporum]|nr:hypothetical protein QL093DRAFT_2473392 [Fusarium oxysporum]
MLAVPFMSAYISEYDGSVLNGIQTLEHWKVYKFPEPPNRLGPLPIWLNKPEQAKTNSGLTCSIWLSCRDHSWSYG